MQRKKYTFSGKTTTCFFDSDFNYLSKLTDPVRTVLITDENIMSRHRKKFKGWNVIVLKPGEEHKVQSTVNDIIRQLIEFKADRNFMIVGVGGGVITDMAGFAASIYMRGIRFGFVPVSLLAMVDAAIGGKNGIDVGVYKNLVGSIRQPEFLLYDSSFLKTLPSSEWANGFAEIIKHACILDRKMFEILEQHSLSFFKKDIPSLDKIIRRNAGIKCAVVMEDEFETGQRKLLNFGHTWGHAIETENAIPHGHAVSIGMVVACKLSERISGFNQTERVIALLKKYNLPDSMDVDRRSVFKVLRMDKKKANNSMNYVLLRNIGKGYVQNVPLDELEELLVSI